MTTRTLSFESKDQLLQALYACIWLTPRQPCGEPSDLASFSIQVFEAAVRDTIQEHLGVSEDADVPDDRDIALELAEYLDDRDFIEVLPQLLGVVQGNPPFDDLLVLVKNIPSERICSDCVAQQVHRAYILRVLRSAHPEQPAAELVTT